MQDESALSRQVYEARVTKGWICQEEEVSDICNKMGIPDFNCEEVNKKGSIISQILKRNQYFKIKIKDIKDDDFAEVQEYFKGKSVENTSKAFNRCCQKVSDIPAKFKSKLKEKGEKGIQCL